MIFIKRPVHTEKSTSLQGQNQYVFLVDQGCNKISIAKAVAALYNVKVDSVNTMRYRGKKVQRFTRKGAIKGKRKNFKKAIVKLVDGHMIDWQETIGNI